MAKIGIIGAMKSEISHFCEDFEVTLTPHDGIFKGKYMEHEVFVCSSGIGKVNAAMSAQKLIDLYSVEYIINSGVAGCLSKALSTCDTVISETLCYHDFNPLDILATNPPYTTCFKADKKLIDLAVDACESLNKALKCKGEKGFKFISGVIVSGDCFVSDSAVSARLVNDFGALCTEMEGAAIAHVCLVNKVPFVVIRAISDFADENAEISFETLEKTAAMRASFIVKEMLAKL